MEYASVIGMRLTDNMEMSDLLGVEMSHTNGTNVRPLIHHFQFVQSNRSISFINNQGSVNA